MSLALYLKLAGGGQPWIELDDYDDDLPSGDVTDAVAEIEHVNYADYVDIWSGAGGDDPRIGEPGEVSEWRYIHDGYGGLDLTEVEAFAHHVLTRVETWPDPAELPADLMCLLETTGGGWGVYSVGVLDPAAMSGDTIPYDERLGRTRLALLLDPSWLDRDFRNLGSRQPWLYAAEATWAVDHLRAALRISVPPEAVLRASLPPVPYGPASEDRIFWPAASPPVGSPEKGRLGPPVTYNDRNGASVKGFITAGHVAQPSGPNQVDVLDNAGALIPTQVARSRMPGGLGTQLGRYLNGAVDGALVSAGRHTVAGLGPAGAAGPGCQVARVGGPAAQQGQVIGYAKWALTGTSAWGNCYMVAGLGSAAFSKQGDSGAAVLAGPTAVIAGQTVVLAGQTAVLGIVEGGAMAVAGCADDITYVQDIARLRRALRCKPIP